MKKFDYTILQLPTGSNKGFCSLKLLKRLNLSFDINDYVKKYNSTIEVDENIWNKEDVLEMLFQKFNYKKPQDFKGHSLSTSDVIILNNETYFCDSFGWEKVG